MPIRRLDPLVVNQIAAGEVIERPASVVKELVENSLDAGAANILVEIEGGGGSLIRVRDDGSGMELADLALAFASHATSKLAAVEDLERIASFGFRGEALASIGAVSRARLLSCRPEGMGGHEIACEGGRLGEPRPAAVPPGTTVEVRDLFFNVPARRRFLRSETSERGRIVDLLSHMALAHPRVAFVLRDKGRELLSIPSGCPAEERVALALGRALSPALVAVEARRGNWAVSGFVARPDRISFRDARNQLLFVNGRLVKDRGAAAAAHKGLEEGLMTGRRPGFVLFLELPPEEVDVNVHPAKTEVRFRNPAYVFALVRDAVRPAARGGAPPRPQSPPPPSTARGAAAGAVREPRPALFPSDLAPSPLRPEPAGPAPRPRASADQESDPPFRNFAPPAEKRPGPHLHVGGAFLLFPEGDGFTLVDQHALHERILFEELMQGLQGQPRVPAQRLLVPALFEAGAADKAALLEARESLARLGFHIADFGPGTIAVEALPAPLAGADAADLMEEILASLAAGGPAGSRSLEERIASAACRAAVKSGERLTPHQVAELLERAAAADHPGHCPHGRPTAVHFARKDLERLFRRTGPAGGRDLPE